MVMAMVSLVACRAPLAPPKRRPPPARRAVLTHLLPLARRGPPSSLLDARKSWADYDALAGWLAAAALLALLLESAVPGRRQQDK